MKSWDVFISHAAEDKETVAWPLAQALIRGGLRVWIDRQELNIGDSLREKIDAGLANSRFGVVILSPKFLAKAWPGRELNALLAIEEAGTKVILPVWHEIDKRTLAAHSPILADRLAGNTAAGIKELARNIIRIVDQDAAFTFPLSSRFNNFLSEDPSPALVHSFLASHPDLLSRAVDVNPSLHTNLIDSPAHRRR